MSELRLRIDKYLTGQASRPPKVYAKIYTLGEGARRVAGSTPRQELVPISEQREHAAVVENLAPGHYYVETVLPSGEILADDVLLEPDSTHELVLHADNSPHEWLSWQHLTGNAPSRQVVERRQARAAAGALKSLTARRGGGAKGGAKGGARGGAKGGAKGGARRAAGAREGGARARAEANAASLVATPSEVSLLQPIMWLSRPSPLLAKVKPDGQSVWRWLADLKGSKPLELMTQLNDGLKPLPVSSNSKDESHAVFNVSWDGKEAGTKTFERLGPEVPRHYVAVPRRDSVELLSLPIPWMVPEGEAPEPVREADIEIAVQEPVESGGFCASAIARDEEFGMLLAYLSSGALSTAREMAETAELMLYHKFTNPFAAAAGGYAMVGTAMQASDRDWHNWVRTLMKKFPHMPDGAIQWGQLRMRMRRTQSDMDEARKAFKEAYKRGLPFYSMGVRWLLDGLETLSRDDSEAEMMLKDVRQVAWRTNFQQPFTILRLGGE